jgi:hypothetical protein
MKYIAAIFGLIVAAFSGFMLWHLMQAPAVDRHLVYLFSGGVGFGMLLVIPTIIVAALKSLLGVIGPYLPQVMIGGRRATDPPPTAAVPVVQPADTPSVIPSKHDDETASG